MSEERKTELNRTLEKFSKEEEENQKLLTKRISDHSIGQSITQLLYGGSGTGKTWYLGTAGDRTIIFDTGRSKATLQSPDFKKMVGSNPIVIDIRESKISKRGDVEGDKVVALDRVCDLLDQALKYNSSDFDTIGIDEMTAFGKSIQYKGMEFNRVIRNTDSFKKARDNKTIPMPEVNDYQAEQQTMLWFFNTYIPLLQEAGKSLIVLAHEHTVYTTAKKFGEEVKILQIMPAIVGKKEFACDTFPSLFDEVWRMRVLGKAPQISYQAETTKNELYVAKTRHGGIIDYVEKNPNFMKIRERIQKQIILTPKRELTNASR